MHESGNACIRIESKVFNALQFVRSSALFNQLIWFAHLLEHPQASHRSGPGISVELKHRVAPKHIAPGRCKCYCGVGYHASLDTGAQFYDVGQSFFLPPETRAPGRLSGLANCRPSHLSQILTGSRRFVTGRRYLPGSSCMVMRYVNRSHTGRCTTNRLPLGGGPRTYLLGSYVGFRGLRIIPLHEAMCEKCQPATWKRLSCPVPVLNRVGLPSRTSTWRVSLCGAKWGAWFYRPIRT